MAGSTRLVPVFLSSSFVGMAAERDHLRQVVLPALLRRYADRAIEIKLIDPAEGARTEREAEGQDALASRLRSVEQCRPFFIGLLGGPCGPALDPLPADALGENPWLSGFSGLTVRHLEIQCRLRGDSPAGAVFYRRRPGFLSRVPAHWRAGLAELDPTRLRDEAELVHDLRQRQFIVRAYDVEFDVDQGSISGLTGFGDQVLEDICAALDAFLAEEQAAARPAPYLDEDVQFTVYRPKVIAPQKWVQLLAFAHLSQRPLDAGQDDPDPVEEVQRQAAQVLGKQAGNYQDVTQDSRQAVPREGELTFLPEVPGVEFNPPRRSFRWVEQVHREEFRLRAAAELDGKTARGRLSVFLGGILLADVTISIRVDSRHVPAAADPPLDRAEARPYRKIFASYSHRDLEVVRQFERLAEALGDRYLRDWTELRAGQVWNDRLMQMIEEADVFQLFWSRHAMRSDFVRQEWEHALTLDRPHFIRPTYWEDPMPMVPEEDLPPPRLRVLHFQRISAEPETGKEPPGPPAPGPADDLGGSGAPVGPPPGPRRLPPRPLSRITRPSAEGPPAQSGTGRVFEDVKRQIHGKLIAQLDLSRVGDVSRDDLRKDLGPVIERMIDTEDPLLIRPERERLIAEVLDETFGFGPLESLLRDSTVTSVFINGAFHVYVDRHGKRHRAEIAFRDNNHLVQIIDRVVSSVGRRVDEGSPLVEARLNDGSHVSVVLPPVALDGPILSLRRAATQRLRLNDLVDRKALTSEMTLFLEAAVRAKLNVLVIGESGAGKTTLLNSISALIPSEEHVITIETAAELELPREHVARLQTRPPNVEGKGELSVRDLLRHALAMRPDRLIVGEISGPEVADLLQAMATGRASLMTTVYALSPSDALDRLEMLASRSGLTAPGAGGRSLVSFGFDLIVQTARLPDGMRRVVAIVEAGRAGGPGAALQEVFRFEPSAPGGQFRATGFRPRCADRIANVGVVLPPDIYENRVLD